ncbi:MAG TPA: DNA polymerase III subunit delta [Anaerolineaceae bacterium]|nr:DNA polymerase III subunit delta [Anaerolineaceae bacterium]
MILLLHGNDTYGIELTLRRQVQALGDPSVADLNLSRLDGRTATLNDLRAAAYAMPFLADHRLVILSQPLARLNAANAQRDFIACIEGLPDSTTLVLVIEDEQQRGEWQTLRPTHWLTKWVRGDGAKRCQVQSFALPRPADMPHWIRSQAEEQGGQFAPPAAVMLANYIGTDTRQASQEITKLLTYVDRKRMVQAQDVELLTAPGGSANVFDMVDALGRGDAQTALRSLHRLLEEQDAISLFGMVVRQFRLILTAREALDQGVRPSALAAELHLAPFVAEKIATQAARFSLPALVKIYHRLLEMDEAAKTSQMPLDLALETFVAENRKQ